MNLKHLTDQGLHQTLLRLVKEEKLVLTQILHHLREVDQRKLYAERGYSSLYEYAQKGLGYSEAASFRRVAAMRLLRDLPEVEKNIQDGSLSLSVIAQAQKFFKDEAIKAPERKKEILSELSGQSARQSEKILLSHATTPVGQVSLHPEKVKPITEQTVKLELIIPVELMEQIRELQAKISHTKANLTETIAYGVQLALKKPNSKTKNSDVGVNPRYISEAKRQHLAERAHHRCEFVDVKSGRRCESRHLIQVDHIIPVAMGGQANLENLRLLCATHNQLLGERLRLII